MSKKKLTLSVEDRLTKKAKTVAAERGTSVSQLVETYFAILEPSASQERAGVTRPSEAESEEGDEDGIEDADPVLENHEFPDWVRRMRGAFKKPGRSYPDDPSWEEDLLAREIADKHE